MLHRLTKCFVGALALVLAAVGPAAAQSGTAKPKSSLSTEINSSLPDNTVGLITPAGVRALNQDFLASWQQAPQVRLVTGTSDTLTAADYGQVIRYNSSNPVAVAIASATSLNPFNVYVQNSNTGTVTITPTGSTIGGLATLVLPVGAYAWIVSDGSNYQIAALGASAGCGAGGFEISNGASFQCSLITANPATINPTPNSTVQGLVINQTSPTSGAVAGPFNYNVINVTAQSATSGSDPNLGNVGTAALRVNLTLGGPNLGANQFSTGDFWLFETIPNSGGTHDTQAVHAVTYSNVASTNSLWAGTFSTRLDTSATNNQIVGGIEIDIGGTSPATATKRTGLHIGIIGGNMQGSVLDSAFLLGNFFGTTGGWKKIFQFTNTDGGSGLSPFDPAADIFYSDFAASIANFINLPTMTVSGDIMNFPNVRMGGTGTLLLGLNSIVLSGSEKLRATGTSAGSVSLEASTNSASGIDGVLAFTSNSNNSYSLYANEPSRTGTFLGVNLANTVTLSADGASQAGLLMGTAVNTGLALGTNNTSRITINGGGNVNVGSQNGAPAIADSLLTINANTGLSVAPPAGTNLHIVGADAAVGTNVVYDSYTGAGQLIVRRADTSRSAPSAIQATERIASLLAIGYGATGYIASGATGGIGIFANQNFTDTVAGTYVDIFTTPNGSTAVAATVRAHASGALSIGTTATDPGTSGVVNVSSGFRIVNAAASGNVLRGNGTSFVSAQLAVSDLSGFPLTLAQGGTNATACANTNGIWYYDGTRFVCNVNTTANTILVGNNAAPSFSASPTIGTSVTTPLVIGGTAAGSTHEIRSTTGTGSADSVFVTGGTNGGTRLATFLGSANQSIFGNSAPPTGLTNVGTYFHPGTDQNTGIIGHLGLSTGVVWFSIADNGSTFLPIEIRGSQIYINDLGASGVSIGTTTIAGVNSLLVAGHVQLGSGTALTLSAGELGFTKITASGTAPGASGAKEEWVCGTNAGTAKRIAYAGTSTTPVTIVDNVGAGVTGC